jgi:chromosome segregation ATPase
MSQRSATLTLLSGTKRRFKDTQNNLYEQKQTIIQTIIQSKEILSKIFALKCKIKKLKKNIEWLIFESNVSNECFIVEYNQFKRQLHELMIELDNCKEQFKQIQQELKSDQSIIDINSEMANYDVMIQHQVELIYQFSIRLGHSPEDYM